MAIQFKKADRSSKYLRLMLTGPTGAGKTIGALMLAAGLVRHMENKRVAVFDTEFGRASLKVGNPLIEGLEFDTFEWDVKTQGRRVSYKDFIDVIAAAEEAGYSVLIIDSCTPEWEDINERHAAMTGNSFQNWGKVKAQFHNKFIESFIHSHIHIIMTARSKMDYLINEDNGKRTVQKVGLAPQQDSNLPYFCDFLFEIVDRNHAVVAEKDETGMWEQAIGLKITPQMGENIYHWLTKQGTDISKVSFVVRILEYQDRLIAAGKLSGDNAMTELQLFAMASEELISYGKKLRPQIDELNAAEAEVIPS